MFVSIVPSTYCTVQRMCQASARCLSYFIFTRARDGGGLCLPGMGLPLYPPSSAVITGEQPERDMVFGAGEVMDFKAQRSWRPW